MRELGHDRNEREQRDPGREHRQTEFRVAVQLPRLGSDITTQAVLSLRLRPGDDACVRRRPARGSRSSGTSVRTVRPQVVDSFGRFLHWVRTLTRLPRRRVHAQSGLQGGGACSKQKIVVARIVAALLIDATAIR